MKPILFNTEMVKAILEGRKISTRRIAKPQPKQPLPLGFISDSTDDKRIGYYGWGQDEYGGIIDIAKPPYKVGDILYVRETYANMWTPNGEEGFVYRADGNPPKFPYWGNVKQCKNEVWIPSIHMPKVAARIFLKVTDIKVQMLQDITEDEAQQEGIDPEVAIEYSNWRPTFYDPDSGGEPNYREAFKDLWDGIYKKKGYEWEGNPWVFVISFKRVEKEE